MKTNIPFILTVWLLMVMGVSTLSAQSRKERREQKRQEIEKVVASGHYKIAVNMALPARGRSVSLTSPYSLEIRNDSVISYLPYYGRAYSVPYGGGKGLNFKAPITEYSLERDRKNRTQVKFSARNEEDTFDFRISIFGNGSSTIWVNMRNRQSISFYGDIEAVSNK